jgi:NitT/TauT family transport system substrate-binding protein
MTCLRLLTPVLAALGLLGFPCVATAQNTVRIVQQFGISYLPLLVALDRKLIESQASRLGIADTKVEVVRLASGAAANDAIISGSVNLAMAGLTVMLNLRDKTMAHAPVKGMMAIADSPIYFNTTDTRIQSVKDLGENDRIAMTAGKGTQHAVVLQMAAAKAFGWEGREKLDSLAVGLSHPDGVAGLLSGGAAFKTHATTVPFIQMELAHPGVRTILSSYDVVGSKHTLIVAYAAEKWRHENPKLYEATYLALAEAQKIIAGDRGAAAALFLKAEPSKLGLDTIQKLLEDPNMLDFVTAPTGVMAYADYMKRSGLLNHQLASWKDAFFDNVHALPGN